jgi:hypothetical protein
MKRENVNTNLKKLNAYETFFNLLLSKYQVQTAKQTLLQELRNKSDSKHSFLASRFVFR